MHCIALDRINLCRRNPRYMIAVAYGTGKIIYSSPDIGRETLKKIINLPDLTEPAVFSDTEFDMIRNLTSRSVILYRTYMQDYLDYHEKDKSVLKPYFFIRVRQIRNHYNAARFATPRFEYVKGKNGEFDLHYSRLIWNAKIMALAAS